MALGPMIGMLVLEAGSYDAVFITAMGCAAGGILLGLLVKKQRVTASRGEKISLDRFFLKKGTYAFIGLVLMAFVYGLLVNYLSVFARERHVMAEPRLLLPAHVPRAHPQPPFRGRHDRQRATSAASSSAARAPSCWPPCSSSSCPRKPCSSGLSRWPSGSASG